MPTEERRETNSYRFVLFTSALRTVRSDSMIADNCNMNADRPEFRVLSPYAVVPAATGSIVILSRSAPPSRPRMMRVCSPLVRLKYLGTNSLLSQVPDPCQEAVRHSNPLVIGICHTAPGPLGSASNFRQNRLVASCCWDTNTL